MDREFQEKMKTIGQKKKRFWQRDESDELEVKIEIDERADGDYAVMSGPSGNAEHLLKSLPELYAPESEAPKRRLGDEEEYMPILMPIEQAIAGYYRAHPSLTDQEVIRVLEKLALKPEIEMEEELCSDIQLNLRIQLSLEDYSRHEVRWAIRKILGSVRRHHKLNGAKGYVDFIIDYV